MTVQCRNHKPLYEDQAVGCLPGAGEATHQKVIPLHNSVHADNRLKKMGGLTEGDAQGRYLKVKDRDAEVWALFNGIIKYANRKNLARAERLLQELIKIAPDALPEIKKSEEIIAQVKTALIDPQKIKSLDRLFKRFTPAEAAAFYSALRFYTIKPNQPVFQQGDCDNRLYFIQSGRCRLSYYDRESKKKVVLANLKKGDIAGVEAFFTHTVHLATLVTLEETGIAYLEKNAYQKIGSVNPGIESKLCGYCDEQKAARRMEVQKDHERKTHMDLRAALKGRVQRIKQKGELEKEAFEVRVVDISSGGLSYIVRNMNIAEAARLKKSRVHVTLGYKKYLLEHNLKKVGRVVSLQFDPTGECLVHVELDNPLEEWKLLEIAKHNDVAVYI